MPTTPYSMLDHCLQEKNTACVSIITPSATMAGGQAVSSSHVGSIRCSTQSYVASDRLTEMYVIGSEPRLSAASCQRCQTPFALIDPGLQTNGALLCSAAKTIYHTPRHRPCFSNHTLFLPLPVLSRSRALEYSARHAPHN